MELVEASVRVMEVEIARVKEVFQGLLWPGEEHFLVCGPRRGAPCRDAFSNTVACE
jgi:hypothetical protein